MYRTHSTILTVALAAGLLAGCGRGKNSAGDSALSRDLNLVPNDSTTMIVSPQERARLETARQGAAARNTPYKSAPRSYSSSSGEVARGAPAPAATRVVKHTQRDAAIGAVAGAVIGGATHGGKGAVIGAASGGVLGAIIGNNVDKKKKKP